LSYLANRQTDKQTKTGKNITFLAEVKTTSTLLLLLLMLTMMMVVGGFVVKRRRQGGIAPIFKN